MGTNGILFLLSLGLHTCPPLAGKSSFDFAQDDTELVECIVSPLITVIKI
jgi:hypothetical protein